MIHNIFFSLQCMEQDPFDISFEKRSPGQVEVGPEREKGEPRAQAPEPRERREMRAERERERKKGEKARACVKKKTTEKDGRDNAYSSCSNHRDSYCSFAYPVKQWMTTGGKRGPMYG